MRRDITLLVFACLLAGCAMRPRALTVVAPAAETAPMPHPGDAADDPAIWVDPADPARSLIIGTDKRGGIAVYDLAGAQLQYLPDGELNNVDLRADVLLGGVRAALVTAGNRSTNRIVAYRVDPAARRLVPVPAHIAPTVEIYGLCMHHSSAGQVYVFVTSKSGAAEQWRLEASGVGLAGRMVRAFDVGSQAEGCVADDARGELYVAEEQVAIWRYGADPAAGDARVSVDTTGPGGQLTSNIEGLALVGDWLLASSQGNSTFAIYRRADNAFVGGFRVGAGGGVDEVSDTDGIEATGAPLGPRFPHGLLVVQDGSNDGANQNFKLVPLQALELESVVP